MSDLIVMLIAISVMAIIIWIPLKLAGILAEIANDEDDRRFFSS